MLRRILAAFVATAMLAGCGGGGSAASEHRGRRYAVSFQLLRQPFGVVATDRYAFVDLADGTLAVLSTTGRRPRVVRSISIPGKALGCSLTRDGRYLLIADGLQGATVVSVARAESGAPQPVIGRLTPPRGSHLRATGAIETSSSADGRYVFVSLEYGTAGGAIAVFKLGSAAHPRPGRGDYVGAITLGRAVVGSTLSPDGRYLYVTSEARRLSRAERHRRRTQKRTHPGALNSGSRLPAGTVSVVSVAAVEHHDLSRAVIATAPAMQQPVRVVVSPDGRIVWVTARASNRVLAFSAAKLRTDPSHALLSSVRVGVEPVGLALFDGGKRLLVADSDRYQVAHAHPALTVVDTAAVLGHRSAVLATLRAGGFAREIAVEPNGRSAFVTDFNSGELETVHLARGH